MLAHLHAEQLSTPSSGTENAFRFYGGVDMADKRKDDTTRRVPPDETPKSTENHQKGPTNTSDAKKVKKDELIDDRFQATDN
jgi:hypothetical protein